MGDLDTELAPPPIRERKNGSMKRKSKLKNCYVCGDRALGFNFSAWTCESCKAFFRRNALKQKDWKCPFNDDCAITSVTRRFCQKCRLKKCFKVGMRKEFIMTEEEKRVKKLKITAKQRKQSVVSTTGGSSSDGDLANSDYIDLGSTDRPQLPFDDSFYAQNGHEIATNSMSAQYQPFSYQFNSVVDDFYSELMSFDSGTTATPVVTNSSSTSVVKPQSPMEKIADAEFTLTPLRSHYETQTPGQKTLNDLEKKAIDELIEANEYLKNSIATDGPSCLRKPTLADIVKMTDSAVRKLIAVCKKVTGFRRLCEDDQIALLKGGCAPLIILHLVRAYNLNTDCWTHGRDGCLLKMDVLKQASNNVYEVLRKFIESFDTSWRNDEPLMLIVSAIALFSPERSNIVHANSVQLNMFNLSNV